MLMQLLLRAIALCGLAASGMAAAPIPWTEREPKPNEVGYRPADGATARLNPPSFIWLHEPRAISYTFQWSRSPDFTGAVTVESLPFNTYTDHRTWAPGLYHWRYRFADAQNRSSNWSQARSVQVPAEANAFSMPDRVQQRARVPAGHPRLFLRPEDLPRLRAVARGECASSFGPLRAEADRLLRREPTPEPTRRGSARDPLLRAYWWPNREQTLRACQEAEVLAFVYLLTGEERYGAAARRWILHLAAWDPDGPTNFRLNCEAAKPLIHRLPRAYDWAWDALSDTDRQTVQKAMLRRVQDAWVSGEVQRGVGHLNSPFNSHGNRIWHKLGECGIAFLGEIPEAETWLDYAVNKFHACYPVWSDDDGGWHEGVSYWAGYMSKAVWWLQVADSALGIDGFKKPFFAQVGDFPMYVAPPHSPNIGFGDLSYRPASSGWGGFLEYFIREASQRPDGGHAGYWRWWAQQWGMGQQDGIAGFLYQANLPPLPSPKAPTDLPLSKVFHGIGIASLHTTLLDSRDDVHFLFKSSPYGTQSHGHNPHNSFQLNAYGEALLTTCVYRDWHGSPFHYRYAHSTRAHNAVLVNGEGQIQHTAAPHGRIVDFRAAPGWDYVAGDATGAYSNRLERYQRHAVLVRPDLIVIYDDLEARAPATFQFMLHALGPFDLEAAGHRLRVDQPQAGVIVQYCPPAPLRFRQSDGFEPPPERPFPNQWHLEAATTEPRIAIGMITVLAPYRAGKAPALSAARLESSTALGVRIERDGQARTVGFRKLGAAGPARLSDLEFEGPVGVR
ncbi:MAG TPA: DUF4962 domain-containing protein [Candidatus Paceibacterota bacterium]|nr:DUF4962 domain-containing protein [Verrucomicrobiota bacterium]HRZ45895.1 DUF4962 domain-containing protein [Candidatus Paceibacterota bacterium]